MADRSDGADKRADVRHPMILRVEWRDREGFVRDATENVSAGGLFVRTEQALAPGTQVKVALSFPGLLEPVEILGEVAWLRPSTAGTVGGVGLKVVGEADRARLAELARAATSPLEGPRRYRILLVEDNPHVIEMYAFAMRRLGKAAGTSAGLDVRFAANGHEALSLVETEGADLVVTDLYMPVMDGFAMLERLRAHTPRIPVLVVSAGGKDAQRRAEDAGADAYLQKPVRFTDVLETIRGLLRLEQPTA